MKMNAFLVSLLVAILALTAVSAAVTQKQSKESDQNESSAANVTSTPDMAQAMTNLLKAFQRIMPCGDPDLGIPVMAPFRIPKVPIAIEDDLLTLKGEIKDLVMTGINDILIIELASNSSSNRTTFDVLYKGFQILGEFDIFVDADLAGYRYTQTLKGLMDLQVLNVRVNGGMTIGVNDNGGMLFSDIEYYVQVGDIISNGFDENWSVAVNNFVNQYFRDSSLLFLQTNRQPLSTMISGYVTPLVNNAFQNITASDYLQGMVDATALYNTIDCSP